MDAYRLRRRQSVNNWLALLRRLAVCRALDRIRRRRPTLSINGLSLAASNAAPESDLIAAELAERLPAAIASLPGREGEVFCLRYFEDLSNQQIAGALDMQSGAANGAIKRYRDLSPAHRSHRGARTRVAQLLGKSSTAYPGELRQFRSEAAELLGQTGPDASGQGSPATDEVEKPR